MVKHYILSLLLILSISSVYAQIIPTEIMYNPPESGNDSLEYLEMYNTTDQPIALNGYTFSQGFEHTFGDDTIQANAYFVIAINDTALFDVLGVMADAQWSGNALSNGGETIELLDDNSAVVFSIEYDASDPWTDAPDGNGPSLELCDLMMDYNDPASWGAAKTATGIMIDGNEIFATPGAANDADCGIAFDHRVEVTSNEFIPADLTINIGETVLWENVNGSHNVDGRQSTYPDNPGSFYSGSAAPAPWEFTHTFTTEGTYDYECTPHAVIGMVGTITVVDPNQLPLYDIGTVTTNDANGVPDSINVECKLRGVIHGANRRSGGYEFALIDEDGDGITVFSSDEIQGYTAQEGDEVEVEGSIGQFNGSTQIDASAIELISSGNDLLNAKSIEELGEDTEDEYIVMEEVEFIDPSEWEGDGSSFNIDIRHLATNRTWTMRIDADVPLADMAEPPLGADGSAFTIRGVGGQFDRDEPYFEGYQIFPSYEDDFMMYSSTGNVYQLSAEIYPNPVQDQLYIKGLPEGIERIQIWNQQGQFVREVTDLTINTSIHVEAIQSGIYYIITDLDGDTYYKKWIKQ